MPFYYTPKKIITNKKAFVAATARKLFCITYIMLLRLACGLGRFFKFPAKNLRSVGGIVRGVSVGEEKIKREKDSILQKCSLGREQLVEESDFSKKTSTIQLNNKKLQSNLQQPQLSLLQKSKKLTDLTCRPVHVGKLLMFPAGYFRHF